MSWRKQDSVSNRVGEVLKEKPRKIASTLILYKTMGISAQNETAFQYESTFEMPTDSLRLNEGKHECLER